MTHKARHTRILTGLAGGMLACALTGCTAVVAGAAAGMMLAQRGEETTNIVDDSVDNVADSAGRAVGDAVRDVIGGAGRSVTKPIPRLPEVRVKPVPPAVPVIIRNESPDDDMGESESRK